MNLFLPKTMAYAITGAALLLSQAQLVFANQQNQQMPPPPSYAQPLNPYGQYNPYAQNRGYQNPQYPTMNRYGNYPPNNFRPNNYAPNNFNPGRFNTPNFGPGNFNGPRFNSNNYPMPWNRNNNGAPWASSRNLPMMNSKEWAEKVPDWGEENGPYKAGPWANKNTRDKAETWWDDMINAPHDMGRMPGGWKAPSISFPNPVDVTDQLGRQFDKLPGQVREMNVSN